MNDNRRIRDLQSYAYYFIPIIFIVNLGLIIINHSIRDIFIFEYWKTAFKFMIAMFIIGQIYRIYDRYIKKNRK